MKTKLAAAASATAFSLLFGTAVFAQDSSSTASALDQIEGCTTGVSAQLASKTAPGKDQRALHAAIDRARADVARIAVAAERHVEAEAHDSQRGTRERLEGLNDDPGAENELIDEIATEACDQAEAVEVETSNLPEAAPKTSEVENETPEVENETPEVEQSGSNQLETETSALH